MATSVADIVAALSVIAGPDGVDPACCPIPFDDATPVRMEGLRVAVVQPDERWPVSSTTAGTVDAAVACLVSSGAVEVGAVERLDLSQSLDITQRYWRRIGMTGAECEQQLGDWDRFVSLMLRSATDFDVVIGPVVADVAPVHRQLVSDDYVFTLPWSLTGWPAMSLPFGVDPSTGLPLAVQIVAPQWRDHVVLATAAVLEKSAVRVASAGPVLKERSLALRLHDRGAAGSPSEMGRPCIRSGSRARHKIATQISPPLPDESRLRTMCCRTPEPLENPGPVTLSDLGHRTSRCRNI